MRPTLLVLALFLLAAPPLYSLSPNCGFKYFKNYSPEDYHCHPQNWLTIQDTRGVIYVANQAGLLEYDGASWKIIDMPNHTACSLAMADNGIIYVGGKSEIGYLAPDSKGAMHYVSLLDKLQDNRESFSSVWYTQAMKEGIYFLCLEYIFRWNPTSGQMNAWKADNPFMASFVCDGNLFIRQQNVGLLRMENNSFKLVPGGEELAAKKVYMMTPFSPIDKTLNAQMAASRNFLIGTPNDGLYLYDGARIKPFPTEVDDYLKTAQLNHGIQYLSSPGDFALATRKGGLVIIDGQGNLKYLFAKEHGLLDDNVRHVYEDNRGNLWLALNNGMAKIEYPSPISLYDYRSGLPGLVLTVVRRESPRILYVGTTNGLYYLTPGSPGIFQSAPGISGNCWSLLAVGDSVLAATSDGVFQVDAKNNGRRLSIQAPAYVLARSTSDPNRVWVGTQQGLLSIYRENRDNSWQEEYTFNNINQEIRAITEDANGNPWLGTQTRGVLKVDFPIAGKYTSPVVTTYGPAHGLPVNEVKVFPAAGHIMFAAEKGLFRFAEKAGVFVPDNTLGETFTGGPNGQGVFQAAEDKAGNIWFHSLSRNYLAIPAGAGKFRIESRPFRRMDVTQVNAIYPDPAGNITWFAGNKGLVCFDAARPINYQQEFPVIIRAVTVNGEPMYGGFNNFPPISAKVKNLRIEFAAPFFAEESKTQFQYIMEGLDETWSAWTSETKKEYTNFDPGTYRFRVKAMNIYETIGREDYFKFTVLPPWYKTWWAYLFYAFIMAAMFYFAVRQRSRHLEKEKQTLEKLIEARTGEINEKNIQLERQTLQLEEQSGRLKEMDRVKSRFFANISHEFRTPLTLIMGPIEQMLASGGDRGGEIPEKQLRMMLRNSRRLLTLINQLLDLSKLDGGKLQLQAVKQDLIPFLKAITDNFGSLARQNKIHLEFTSQLTELFLYFDPGKMEQVFCNILINAVKFTPAGGKITVTVSFPGPGSDIPKHDDAGPGMAVISVKDTGVGIPPDQLPHIFDRFYQAESPGSLGRYSGGTGIGLSLTRELVGLHGGEITARSHIGQDSGTEFIIHLPVGKDHLKSTEIIETPGVVSPPQGPNIYGEFIKEEESEEKEITPDRAPGLEEAKEEKQEKDIILVVEDNADVRQYIRAALETRYNVVSVENGKDGIDKAIEIVPDLIVSDIMMPGVDGYQLLKTLKQDVKTSHIPIILLTAKAAEENILQGLETGADDYIVKPFNPVLLAARVKNLIELRRQLQQRIKRTMLLQPAEVSVSSIDEEFLKEVMAVMEKNLSDSEFNVEQLGKKLYMSRASLYRKIMALTGESPQVFIRSYRLKRAAQLLKANSGNVTEVAMEVGFNNIAYFSQCFKEEFHQSPSTFQASQTGTPSS